MTSAKGNRKGDDDGREGIHAGEGDGRGERRHFLL